VHGIKKKKKGELMPKKGGLAAGNTKLLEHLSFTRS